MSNPTDDEWWDDAERNDQFEDDDDWDDDEYDDDWDDDLETYEEGDQ